MYQRVPLRGLVVLCLVVGCQPLAWQKRPKNQKKQDQKFSKAGQYKKFTRALISMITTGQVDEAIAEYERRLEKDPKDLECHFGLAVAHSRRDDLEKAMQHAKRAVELGLPIGRFHAGPRNLTKKLTESPAFRELAASHPVDLIHGPMLGSMTDTSVRVWVRTARESRIEIEISKNADLSDARKTNPVSTSSTSDFTAVTDVTGLEPNTVYFYQVVVDGKLLATKPSAPFRTFPAGGKPASFKIVFGGGSGYVPEHERMWNTIEKQGAAAFLALGDNVYIDRPQLSETQRYCYYRRQSRPEYRRFVASCPVFAIWDDHDFGTNDCLGSPGTDDIPWKMPVWRVFRENWPTRATEVAMRRPASGTTSR